MSLVAGSVVHNGNGTFTGSGYALVLANACIASMGPSNVALVLAKCPQNFDRLAVDCTAQALQLVTFVSTARVYGIVIPAGSLGAGIPATDVTIDSGHIS